MKTKLLLFSTAVLLLIVIFTACKKNNSGTTTDNSTEASAQADDQQRVSNETQAVANDADASLEATSNFSGRSDRTQVLICDATIVVDTVSNPRTITITYSGSTCLGNRTRTGEVVISMAQGVHWKDVGAVVTIAFHDLKVTRVSDNKSITINGTHTYTNVSGGLLRDLATLLTITHTFTSADMSVTFDDNSQRTWQVAEQRVFTWDNNSVVITASGTHTDGTINNIAEWGLNRFGHAFVSATVEPLVLRQDCDFRITSGEVKHVTPAVTATTTFGLDSSGNPTTCPGTGHYYFKIVWTGPNGNTLTAILPY